MSAGTVGFSGPAYEYKFSASNRLFRDPALGRIQFEPDGIRLPCLAPDLVVEPRQDGRLLDSRP